MNITWPAIQSQTMVILVDSYGETDFAVIKLKIPELVNKDSAVCTIIGYHTRAGYIERCLRL